MKKRILLFLVILTNLGLTACDGISGGPTDTSNYHPAVLFVETWESYSVGSPPGGGWRWPDPDLIPYFERTVDIPSNHKLLLHGPDSEAGWGYGGVYYPFKQGTMLPTYIHYKVHPYPDYQEISLDRSDVGNFCVTGYQTNSIHTIKAIEVGIFHNPTGLGFINSNTLAYPSISYTLDVDQSFEIELRNIQWNSSPQTFDLWINGVEVITCIEFLNPIESIASLRLYNGTYGRAHFDDIYMADLPVEYNCPVVSEDPPTMPLQPVLPPSDPVLFIIQMPAFCRGGPSTEYPKISTFPEGTKLEISGQNIEGSWWWSEEGGCWVSDSVGKLIGDKTTLEIIIPPPPPEEDAVDKKPGKSTSCKKDLGKAACLEAGGTWDDQPGQPGTCVCP